MKKGFTMAEVLITLGIIGVISAMTIPVLVGNYQKRQTVTRLKKFYSEMNQALILSTLENGDISEWDFPTVAWNGEEAIKFAEKYLIPYLKITKKCGQKPGCMDESFYKPQSTEIYSQSNNRRGNYLLSNGTGIGILTQGATWIEIQVNLDGARNPKSIAGRNRFFFVLRKDKKPNFIPYNYGVTSETRDGYLHQGIYSCEKGKNGVTCAGVILIDGWQIKDDYPW